MVLMRQREGKVVEDTEACTYVGAQLTEALRKVFENNSNPRINIVARTFERYFCKLVSIGVLDLLAKVRRSTL